MSKSSHFEEGVAGQISELSGLVTKSMAHKIEILKERDYIDVALGVPHYHTLSANTFIKSTSLCLRQGEQDRQSVGNLQGHENLLGDNRYLLYHWLFVQDCRTSNLECEP